MQTRVHASSMFVLLDAVPHNSSELRVDTRTCAIGSLQMNHDAAIMNVLQYPLPSSKLRFSSLQQRCLTTWFDTHRAIKLQERA